MVEFNSGSDFRGHACLQQHIRAVLWGCLWPCAILLSVLIANSGGTCLGQRVGWIPGDAVYITHKWEIFNDRLRFIHHSYPDLEDAGIWSYGGFFRLDLEANKESLLALEAALAKSVAYLSKKQAGCEITCLVYNTGFDLKRHRLGLRYNEHWVENKGTGPADGRSSEPRAFRKYPVLINTAEAVVLDWRDAASVPSLRVKKIPRTDWQLPGEIIWDPLEINADKVVFYLLRKSSLKECCERNMGTTFVKVSLGTNPEVLQWIDYGERTKVVKQLK